MRRTPLPPHSFPSGGESALTTRWQLVGDQFVHEVQKADTKADTNKDSEDRNQGIKHRCRPFHHRIHETG